MTDYLWFPWSNIIEQGDWRHVGVARCHRGTVKEKGLIMGENLS